MTRKNTPKTAISGAAGVNTSAAAKNAGKRRKSTIDGKSLKLGEHESVIAKEHTAVEIILDGKTYTLPELIDAYWTATFERNALAGEIERSMTAMVRIYGLPPYDDCSLSEYLEIIAAGQLDQVRKDFEDGI